jgi:cardiolipin synthase
MMRASRSRPQTGHRLRLLQGAQAFFGAMVAAMDESQHEIRLETYIFDFSGGSEAVATALERAAVRGVAVFLVVDGVGTPGFPLPWIERLNHAGIQWRVFAPLGRLGLLFPSQWRRLHRKLCVVDGQVAFCGGINVLDDWYDPNHGALTAPRFDFAVQVSGPLVQQAQAAMTQFWWRMRATERMQQADLAGASQALQRSVRDKPMRQPGQPELSGALAELVLRDNLRNRTNIERAYRLGLSSAREDIVLANAYFLPGRNIRRTLIYAARRGVRVRLLLQGRYEYFMQYHAAHAMYRPLLAAGIEIYEYSPSFLHAKVAVVDGRWATVGSSNMDPLSLLLAREANVFVQDETFAQELRLALEHAIAHDASRVDAAQHALRPLRLKLFDVVAAVLLRVLLFLNGKRY